MQINVRLGCIIQVLEEPPYTSINIIKDIKFTIIARQEVLSDYRQVLISHSYQKDIVDDWYILI